MSESDSSERAGRSGRWQRRQQRRASERERVQKHGAGLRTVYRDAILKRMRGKKKRK